MRRFEDWYLLVALWCMDEDHASKYRLPLRRTMFA
jgi:hypothetical protein